MDEWAKAHAALCKAAIDRHLADGGQHRGRFGMDLVLSMKASVKALPAERAHAIKMLGNRLVRDVEQATPVKVLGLAGKTFLREEREQLMFDIGTLLGGKFPRSQ